MLVCKREKERQTDRQTEPEWPRERERERERENCDKLKMCMFARDRQTDRA